MTKFDPINVFTHFNKVKPEGYSVSLESDFGRDNNMAILLHSPIDLVFVIVFKEDRINIMDLLTDTLKKFENDIDKSVGKIEVYTNKLIQECLESED